MTGPEPWTRTRWRYRGGPPRTGPAAADAVDVLVVDDEESVRSSICEVLETAGMTTAKAADGQEAIELLSRTRFGAMVVDIRMPRLDGLEMLQRLSDPPPTVLVSAYAIDEEVRERLSAKVRDFLQKPFRPAELLQAVSSALGRPL